MNYTNQHAESQPKKTDLNSFFKLTLWNGFWNLLPNTFPMKGHSCLGQKSRWKDKGQSSSHTPSLIFQLNFIFRTGKKLFIEKPNWLKIIYKHQTVLHFIRNINYIIEKAHYHFLEVFKMQKQSALNNNQHKHLPTKAHNS